VEEWDGRIEWLGAGNETSLKEKVDRLSQVILDDLVFHIFCILIVKMIDLGFINSCSIVL